MHLPKLSMIWWQPKQRLQLITQMPIHHKSIPFQILRIALFSSIQVAMTIVCHHLTRSAKVSSTKLKEPMCNTLLMIQGILSEMIFHLNLFIICTLTSPIRVLLHLIQLIMILISIGKTMGTLKLLIRDHSLRLLWLNIWNRVEMPMLIINLMTMVISTTQRNVLLTITNANSN